MNKYTIDELIKKIESKIEELSHYSWVDVDPSWKYKQAIVVLKKIKDEEE